MRRGSLALAALVLLVAASCAKHEGDLDEKDSATGEWAATIELLPAVGDLVQSLQQERAASIAGMLGPSAEALGPSLDVDTARAETDDAVETFSAAITDSDHSTRLYQAALDELDALDEVRAEVDSEAGTGSILDSGAIESMATSYGDVVTGIVEANTAATVEIDDPQVRRGAELYAEGLRQTEVSASLLFVVISGLDPNTNSSSAWVSEVARLATVFDEGWSFVEETAASSPYEPLADQLQVDLDEAGYFDTVPDLVNQTSVDGAVVRSVVLPRDKAWWPFVAGVEHILRGR
jgi:hypothetical protein